MSDGGFMDFNQITTKDLLDSVVPEVAKALNEVRHAQDDLDKAESRLKFVLAVIHNLKTRDIKE
jgi:hypothetical protein